MEHNKTETPDSNPNALWEAFSFTGKIGAYLAYRAVSSAAERRPRS